MCLSTFFCMFLVCMPLALQAAPNISCPSTVFDFGTTNSSARVRHVFELENTGDQTLEIASVKCCCAAQCSTPASRLLPGEKTAFSFEMSLQKKQGKIEKRIYVRSNDPKCMILPLVIKGSVVNAEKVSSEE